GQPTYQLLEDARFETIVGNEVVVQIERLQLAGVLEQGGVELSQLVEGQIQHPEFGEPVQCVVADRMDRVVLQVEHFQGAGVQKCLVHQLEDVVVRGEQFPQTEHPLQPQIVQVVVAEVQRPDAVQSV